MCLAKFSAQTEQMAAIFNRCGERPSALSMVWASAMIRDARFAQSGSRAHSSPSEATKTPSKPCLMAWRIQDGRMPLVHGMLMTRTPVE